MTNCVEVEMEKNRVLKIFLALGIILFVFGGIMIISSYTYFSSYKSAKDYLIESYSDDDLFEIVDAWYAENPTYPDRAMVIILYNSSLIVSEPIMFIYFPEDEIGVSHLNFPGSDNIIYNLYIRGENKTGIIPKMFMSDSNGLISSFIILGLGVTITLTILIIIKSINNTENRTDLILQEVNISEAEVELLNTSNVLTTELRKLEKLYKTNIINKKEYTKLRKRLFKNYNPNKEI